MCQGLRGVRQRVQNAKDAHVHAMYNAVVSDNLKYGSSCYQSRRNSLLPHENSIIKSHLAQKLFSIINDCVVYPGFGHLWNCHRAAALS